MTWVLLLVGGVMSWTLPPQMSHLSGAWRVSTDSSLLSDLTIRIDLDDDCIRCVIELHGAVMESESPLSGIRGNHLLPSEHDPWRLRWGRIRLIRPPHPSGAHVRTMMRMLPRIYHIQRHGMMTNITSVYYKHPNIYTSVRLSTGDDHDCREMTLWRPVK